MSQFLPGDSHPGILAAYPEPGQGLRTDFSRSSGGICHLSESDLVSRFHSISSPLIICFISIYMIFNRFLPSAYGRIILSALFIVSTITIHICHSSNLEFFFQSIIIKASSTCHNLNTLCFQGFQIISNDSESFRCDFCTTIIK